MASASTTAPAATGLLPPTTARHSDAGVRQRAATRGETAGDRALTDAAPIIAGLLASSGWTLDDAAVEQVRAAPGRYTLARHRVTGRDRNGQCRGLQVCVESRRRPRSLPEPPAGLAARLGLDVVAGTVDGHQLWVYPYDPDLAALPGAVSGAAVAPLLRAAGLVEGPALVHARLLRYRPGRRAVVRYQIVPRPGRGDRPRAPRSGRALFAKVLRSDRADRVRQLAGALDGLDQSGGRDPATNVNGDVFARAVAYGSPIGGGWRRHADLRLAIPSPLDDGLFVAPAIGGSSLRDLLLGGGSLPDPGRLAWMLGAIAAIEPAGEMPPANERRHPARLLDHAVGLLGHVLPERRDAVERAAGPIVAGMDGWQPTALVHGDLYDDQIFIDERGGLGLIDLDDMGPGDPAIDAANACAHLLALAAAVPSRALRLVAYRELLRASFIERLGVSPADFAWREALALLLLATGPFRVQSARWQDESSHLIDLAVRLTSRDREGSWRTCS
jgi:hypothetical protein